MVPVLSLSSIMTRLKLSLLIILLGHCRMWHTLTVNIHTVTSIVNILHKKIADTKGSLNLHKPQPEGGRKQSDTIIAHKTTNLVMAGHLWKPFMRGKETHTPTPTHLASYPGSWWEGKKGEPGINCARMRLIKSTWLPFK